MKELMMSELHVTQAYLSPWKTSKMELFSNILIIFEKISIIDMR